MNDLSLAKRIDPRTHEERLAAAMSSFDAELTRKAALYLDACIHCGSCAEACPFYVATNDARYTPALKLEPLRRMYRRGAGPFAWLHRAVSKPLSFEELEAWQEQLYDSCTMCGRCTLACPMGIDIAGLVGMARHGLFAAGLAPPALHDVAEREQREGSPLGATPAVLKERLDWLADENDVALRVDLPKADVLLTLSSIEIMKYPASIVAMARILERSGVTWTLSTRGYEATNFGLLAGGVEWQRESTMKLVDAAVACGAKTVIVPECGHAYSALRWQGAAMLGRELPFRVQHITEFLAEKIANGQLRLKPAQGSVTFHDPCQISRRGGATAAPRAVLHALGLEQREAVDSGDLGYCCGGGGGVIANPRADALRYKTYEIRLAQLEATGADRTVTSCANCRQTFDDGAIHFRQPPKVGSLVELVAAQLA